jgi:hypothetical protein
LIVKDQDIVTLKNLVEVTMKATHSTKNNPKTRGGVLKPLQGNKQDLSLSRHKKNFIQIILLQFSAIKAYPLLYVEKIVTFILFTF